VARVVAQHAGAAQLLQHAGGELRRSLETQGLTLLQLDIGASGEQGGQAAGEQRGFGGSGASADGDAAAADDAAQTDDPDRTLTLPNGALVDVLA
jgi:flagellar hook-length control protein FliK